MPTYFTHDNGFRPFKVIVEDDKVNIYKANKEDEYTELVKNYRRVKKVHVGRSTGGIGDHTKAQEDKFLGNSILLEFATKCVFIGHEIYEFAMDDTIVKYFSKIGNNDVPYPVIVGSENVYFMLDRVYVDRIEFPEKMTNADWEDSYRMFYGTWDTEIHKRIDSLEDFKEKMKKFKLIHKRIL
jgi:hypothetical protein